MDKDGNLLVPTGWYEPWELKVNSWQELTKAVNKISTLNPDRRVLWRGVENANYSLVSKLHRKLALKKEKKHRFAGESTVSFAEMQAILTSSLPWRLNETDVPKLMAKLQHMGAPTRFIDVTSNALVAAWFACRDDQDEHPSETDGRLFAFGVNPNNGYSFPGSESDVWPFSKPYFETKNTLTDQNAFMHWFPPFDSHIRIFAQNAGFIFGHSVSLDDAGIGAYPKFPAERSKTTEYWKPEEVQSALGLHVKFGTHGKPLDAPWEGSAAYTLRISKEVKAEIRTYLRRNYGISQATMFPGIEGFAQTLSSLDPHKWGELLEDTNMCFA